MMMEIKLSPLFKVLVITLAISCVIDIFREHYEVLCAVIAILEVIQL